MLILPEIAPYERTCHVIGAGPVYGYVPDIRDGDMLIAADGGLRYLDEMGLIPDHVVGDFDSLGTVPEMENVTVLPVIKDDTDMLTAIETGLSKGYGRFLIYGGTGGRIDHTIANIQHLAFLVEKGARGFLLAENNIVTMTGEGELRFSSEARGFLSIFAYGGAAEDVTISGMKYEISGRKLDTAYPLGVSNEFLGKSASVRVGRGKLLIVYERNSSKA